MGKNNAVWLSAKALLVLFFFFAFFYPLSMVLLKATAGLGVQNAAAIVLQNAGLIRNSFLQAVVSTFFSVLVGLPLAFIVAKRNFFAKKILKALFLVPFVFPSILVVLSFVIIFGNNGLVNRFLQGYLFFPGHIQFLYGFGGIILAHVFYNFPIVALFVSNAWEQTGTSMKEAAKSLGENKTGVFLRITLPQLMPSILASASIVFIYCFMSFAIVLVLGGIQFSTLETEIFRQITRNIDFGAGAVLSLAQFVILLPVTMAYAFFSKKFAIKAGGDLEKPKPLRLGTLRGTIETAFLLLCVAFIALPVFSLIAFAFFNWQTGEFSLRAIEKIFSGKNTSLLGATALSSVFFSLALAAISSLVATLAGLFSSLKHSRILLGEIFLSASIAVSVITLAFGYLAGFGPGNFFVIALGHTVLAFPFARRIIKNALDKIDSESIDAATTLGADSLQVFLAVQLPRIKTSLAASVAFCFAVSLGELGLVLVLSDGIYPTMPVYIYRLLATFDIASATAMGLLLIFISFLAFYAIERLQTKVQVV